MKRFIGELLIFIFGFALGFGELLYLYATENEEMLDVNIILFINRLVSIIDNDFLQLIPWWAYALVVIIILMVLGIVVSNFLRVFANSENINVLKGVLYFIVTIIVAIPFARFIMIFIDKLVRDYLILITLEQVKKYVEYNYNVDFQFVFFSIVRGIVFSILLRLQIYAFGFTYFSILRKPVRNCRVLLCEALEEGCEVKGVLAKRLTFGQCYNFMKNYTGEIEKRHFFQINEKGIFGIRVINKWNYYRDGHVMDCSEEEFLSKLYNMDFQKKLSLKIVEDKDE